MKKPVYTGVISTCLALSLLTGCNKNETTDTTISIVSETLPEETETLPVPGIEQLTPEGPVHERLKKCSCTGDRTSSGVSVGRNGA